MVKAYDDKRVTKLFENGTFEAANSLRLKWDSQDLMLLCAENKKAVSINPTAPFIMC